MERDLMANKKPGGKKGPRKSSKKKPKDSAKKRAKPRPSTDLVNYKHMHALSKQLRVEILAILCERVASPKELSAELDEGLSQVSYHIQILRKCRLIELDHKAQRRGAIEHFYRAAAPTLVPRGAWNNLPPAMREKVISPDILREFFADASASIRTGIFDRPPSELSHTPLILDRDGCEELERLCEGFLDSLTKLQAKVDKRLAKEGTEATDATSATVFLATFPSTRGLKEGKKASARRRR
jgi:DNA-binding transcriptional ArsR family regulator